MKTMRNTLICLALTLLSVPVVHAQDLSKYRQFSLGASLAEVSKQIDQRPGEASVIQQSPAAIQQMEWWPVALNVLTKSEPVQKVTFSFYNHTLYKIAVTYDDDATAGLTVSDMLRAISASYGPVTGAATETDSHSNTTYGATETVGRMGRRQILDNPLTGIRFECFSTRCAYKTAECRSRSFDCRSC